MKYKLVQYIQDLTNRLINQGFVSILHIMIGT